jgi:hypothetical protein
LDKYLRYVADANELDALINGLGNEDEHKQKQLASANARKEKTQRQLEELRRKVAKPAEEDGAPLSSRNHTPTTIGRAAANIIKSPIRLARLMYRSVRSNLAADYSLPERMAALQSKIEKDARKMSELQLWIDTPWEAEIFARFQASDMPELLLRKREREAFMLQFRQTNGLPRDDSFNQQMAFVDQASRTMLSPEVQKLARRADQKIAAVMLHKQQTGASAAEAKSAVEAFALGVRHPLD